MYRLLAELEKGRVNFGLLGTWRMRIGEPPPLAHQPGRLEEVEVGQGRGREGAWGGRVVKVFSPV